MPNFHPFPAHAAPQPWAYPRPAPMTPGQKLLALGLGAAAIWALFDLLDSSKQPQRTCAVCVRAAHDRRTCSYDGGRLNFCRSIPKSSYCECCGSPRYKIQRHHTRGRANPSDFLDVCNDCHVECCHGGHFENLAIKPQICRISGRRSLWCR